MAEQKEPKKILLEDLSQAKKVMLVQTAMTPGFKVIIEMANDACLRATQDIARLDPEAPDYERKAIERARRARNISEFSDLLFASIYGHVEFVKKQEATEDKEAEKAVENRFGIHPATPGISNDAVVKTFGGFPSKPVKKQSK